MFKPGQALQCMLVTLRSSRVVGTTLPRQELDGRARRAAGAQVATKVPSLPLGVLLKVDEAFNQPA